MTKRHLGSLALCVGAALLPLIVAPRPARAEGGSYGAGDGADSVPALILEASQDYGVDYRLMMRLSWCESRHQRWAFNRWSGASGPFQWLPSSFAEVAPQAGYAGASVWDAEANVRTAAYAISRGQIWRWRACL